MRIGLVGINKRGDHLRPFLHTGDKRDGTIDIVIIIVPIADDRRELRASILDRRDILHGGIPVGEVSRPYHVASLIG